MGGRKRLAGLAILALLIGAKPDVHAETKLELKLVATNLSQPLFVCAPRGDTNRIFILEQYSGMIKILNLSNLTLNPKPFLEIRDLPRTTEQGLLGLAFDPGYASNGIFYVNFTPNGGGPAGHTEVAQFRVSSDPNVADMQSKKIILSFPQPDPEHKGGWMDFGRDGYLYISSGDGGGGDDRHGTIGNAQDRNTLLGKILRIDVHGGDPYAIPEGNPFKGDSTRKQEIWAFGLRNPWRCSFDRETGDLWIGDVGQNTREEIDRIPAGKAGMNFGWRPREGMMQNSNYTGKTYPAEQPVSPATDPLVDYDHSTGVAIIGGYCYRGREIDGLQGAYFYGDYGAARFWTGRLEGEKLVDIRERTAELNPTPPKPVENLSSFGEDASGELYVCDSAHGLVYKIVKAGQSQRSSPDSAGTATATR